MNPELLAQIKKYIRVTWDEDDDNITALAKNGIAYINSITGDNELHYKEGSQENALLLDYVRLAYNHAAEQFPVNFQHQIIALQLTVARNAAEAGAVDNG